MPSLLSGLQVVKSMQHGHISVHYPAFRSRSWDASPQAGHKRFCKLHDVVNMNGLRPCERPAGRDATPAKKCQAARISCALDWLLHWSASGWRFLKSSFGAVEPSCWLVVGNGDLKKEMATIRSSTPYSQPVSWAEAMQPPAAVLPAQWFEGWLGVHCHLAAAMAFNDAVS